MIQANELRIGNWFTYGNQSVNDKVFKIDFDRTEGHLINGSIPEDYLQPIPLTPEILEKVGFVQGDVRLEFNLEGFSFGKSLVHEHVLLYDHNGYNTGVSVKYLHQLQNLYFPLTGQELEIKL